MSRVSIPQGNHIVSGKAETDATAAFKAGKSLPSYADLEKIGEGKRKRDMVRGAAGSIYASRYVETWLRLSVNK